MVVFYAESVLWTATIVWVLWRLYLGRRQGPVDVAREAVVTALFLWALLVTKVTMFPLTIIFYDWHGSSNLTPFASIAEIVQTTSPEFAIENIGGNLVMFVPFGFLLPVLFAGLRRPGAVLWRAAAVSALIESAEYITRARSVDIDDVILNSAGAMIGYAAFAVVAGLADRTAGGRRLGRRLAAETDREPLLAAAVPLLLTVAIAVPMMLSTIAASTLGGGAGGIEAYATAGLAVGEVVARHDIGNHTFLVASGETPTGYRLTLSDFEKVLPGRYTWLGTSTGEADTASSYQYYYPAFNPTAGERPMVVVWGRNADNAASVRITGNGIDTVVSIDPGRFFVVGSSFAHDTTSALDEFRFTFADGNGRVLPTFEDANA